MRMKCSSPILVPIFLAFVICTLAIDATATTDSSTAANNNDVAVERRGAGNEAQTDRKHKHHLFLPKKPTSYSTVYLAPTVSHILALMGGLKTLAALVLIKIKIVLVAVAIFGVLAFTMKFLGVFSKFGFYNYPPVLPAYSYGPPASSWEHSEHPSHEHFGHDWSKTGIEGARSLADIISRHPKLSELLTEKSTSTRWTS